MDLRRGNTDAAGIGHGGQHVVDQRFHGGVKRDSDFCRHLAQDRLPNWAIWRRIGICTSNGVDAQ